jgi:hypothetical protein
MSPLTLRLISLVVAICSSTAKLSSWPKDEKYVAPNGSSRSHGRPSAYSSHDRHIAAETPPHFRPNLVMEGSAVTTRRRDAARNGGTADD